MSYEMREADVYGLAAKLGIETRRRGNELFFQWCPYCHGGGHDKETLSVNLTTGTYNCFRESCGAHGHFVQMARDFSFPLEFNRQEGRRQYRKLKQTPITVREPAVEYLARRGIGREVAARYRITTREDNDRVLVFPFYNPGGTLEFVKYRRTDFDPERHKNKEWCEKDTKPILFGMDQCKGFRRLVITEGQLDSLSAAEAGVENAVSVPTGAAGFTWLEHCWDWITKFQEIVVFGDCEKGRVTLVDELARRLPLPVKVVQVEDYLGEKDANDILRKYGPEAVRQAVEKARILPVSHIKELADVEAVDIYSLERIKTGLREVDRLIGGMYFGQVILLTGKRGEGKSTFMGQLLVEALDQGYKVLAYSGELTDYHFKRWMDFQAAGPRYVVENANEYGDPVYILPEDVVERINAWYRGRAYIYDNNAVEEDEFTGLLDTVEQAICRYGVRFICLDNLMTALDVDLKDDLYRAQSKFMRRLKQMAVRHNVVILVVAHPRKSDGGKKNGMDNDDVAGSGDITNRVDVVLSYARAGENDGFDSKLSVLKNRLTGRTTQAGKEIQLFYSRSTKRITSLQSNGKSYGWEDQENLVEGGFMDLPF